MRITSLALIAVSTLIAACGKGRDVDLFPGGKGGEGGSAQGGGGSGGSGGSGLNCPPNAPPAPPALTAPEPNRIDIIPNTLVISSTAFSDPDAGDKHAETDFEIWTLKNGTLDERVWRAQVTDAAKLTQVTLNDGALQGTAAQDGALKEWEEYAVRARYIDNHGDCAQASEWSEPVKFRTDDGSTYLFDPTVIREFYIYIPPSSWDPINQEASPPGCNPYKRNYYTGSLTFEGQVFDGVGIHIKGGCGSARDLSGKAGFKLSLDWDDPNVPGCPEERRLLGQKSFALNNGVQDDSFIHERLGYMLYQAFDVPTPRAAHVHLFVNNQDWGMYLNVETISRRFLARRFGSNTGMLYEGTYGCDMTPNNMPAGTDDTGCFTREFSPTACSPQDPTYDPMDYELARQLADQIKALPPGKFYPEIEKFFHFDRFLSQWAVESLLSHWDAYVFSIINNYRVYHDPSDNKWSIIPTGIDQTFVSDQDPWDVYGVLGARCTAEPTCNQAFAARLNKVNKFFINFDLPTKAQAIHDLILPGIQADPRKEYDMNQFNNAYQSTLNYFSVRPGEIQQYLAWHGF